jgi:hypothetical protein
MSTVSNANSRGDSYVAFMLTSQAGRELKDF